MQNINMRVTVDSEISPWYRKNVHIEDDLFDATVYLHGKLYDDAGYDYCVIINALSGGLESSPGRLAIEGSLPVQVLGCNKPCTGYFWTIFDRDDNGHIVWKQTKGLIVYNDDIEATREAESKMLKRAKRI